MSSRKQCSNVFLAIANLSDLRGLMSAASAFPFAVQSADASVHSLHPFVSDVACLTIN